MAIAKELRGNMTTPELEVAIMEGFDLRKNLIVPNIQAGMGLHECDLLMCRVTGYGVEFECKLTKSDLAKDFKKDHAHESELIKETYYVVPKDLVSECMRVLPKRFGIIMVFRNASLDPEMKIIREAGYNENARKWTDEERFKLARLGTMRICKLKKEWIKCKRGKQ